jgi:chromosome partitioning protein
LKGRIARHGQSHEHCQQRRKPFGAHTLLIDFDPQSNPTTGWGLDPAALNGTIYDAMTAPETVAECIVSLRPRLDLIPANLDLARAELAFINAIDRNNKLHKALAPIAGDYDQIGVDCQRLK